MNTGVGKSDRARNFAEGNLVVDAGKTWGSFGGYVALSGLRKQQVPFSRAVAPDFTI